MDNVEFINMAFYLIKIVLYISLPPIIVASGVGILISLIQALTQIQEQTITFAFKLVAVTVTIILLSGWMSGQIYNFTMSAFHLLKYY